VNVAPAVGAVGVGAEIPNVSGGLMTVVDGIPVPHLLLAALFDVSPAKDAYHQYVPTSGGVYPTLGLNVPSPLGVRDPTVAQPPPPGQLVGFVAPKYV
jgi:hypothetical protein